MKISSERRRLLVAAVVAAPIAGATAGLVLGRDNSGQALAQGPPHVIAEGKFRSLTWNTIGTAFLVREPSGDLKLQLSRSFMTKDAPELYVYLAKLHGQQRVVWKQVGPRRNSQGLQA